MPARALLASHAGPRSPAEQRSADRALLAAAALGELHLHVGSLAGDALAIGALHLEPSASDPALVWRRATGGRAVACGDGFAIVSLALPHRSALIADDPLALRPEQVMNRAVRGVLAALRALGVDAAYPGLDLVTAGRRAIAHVSFFESSHGPTLFQAIVALRQPLSRTAALLDRFDPAGAVPATILAAGAATTLLEASRGGPGAPGSAAGLALGDLAAAGAAAYAETFGLEVLDLDPEVAAAMLAGDATSEAALPPPPTAPPSLAGTASATGVLGPISAWATLHDGAVDGIGITGDVVAPEGAVAAVAAALLGSAGDAADVAARVASAVDGQRLYFLGLRRGQLAALLAEACATARARP